MSDGRVKTDGLVEYLHAFPHLNRSLYDISNKNFNFSNDQYMQSLEVYCISGIALGIVLFLTFAFIQCCLGCRRCGSYTISYRMKQYNPFLTAFLFFSTLAVMVCAIGALYYGVGQIQAEVNNMSRSIADISETVDQYDDLLDSLRGHVETLKNNSFLLPKGDAIAAKLNGIDRELRNDKVPDFHDDLNRMIKFNRTRELVTLAILLLQLLCCSTLLIGMCYGRVFVLHCSLIMLTLCMLFLAASLGVYLAGAVASADICVEHLPIAEILVHMQDIATDVIRIFLNCNKGSGNDLTALQNLDKFVNILHKALGPTEKLLPLVSQTLGSITEDARKLEKLTDCQQLIQDYENVLGVLCKPFLVSMCMYCLWACLGVFFGWLVINQLKPFADRVEEWMKVECILDKNITITPDVDETDNLMSEDAFPPSYRKSYGSSNVVYLEEEESADSFSEHLKLIHNEQSLYQSLISNSSNHFLARKMSNTL